MMSLLQYFRPRNEKYSNDEILPSPADSLSTFSLSFNTFYSDSSRELFHKEGDETKHKIAISFNFDSRAAISSGKESRFGLEGNECLCTHNVCMRLVATKSVS